MKRDDVGGELLAQRAAQTLGEREAPRCVGVREDQRELLAADPGDPVDLALALLEHARDPLQRGVTRVMT